MLKRSKKLLAIILISSFATTGGALAQGMGGGGHGGGGMGGGMGGGSNQDSLVLIELTGTVIIDSVAWGNQMDSTGGCELWDSTFTMGDGHDHHGAGHTPNQAFQSQEIMDREIAFEHDSLMAVYFLDIDSDGIEDYVLNFGPVWYIPEDSNLTRPAAGDIVTITGALMEDSPMWDMDLVVVTVLDGSDWRELGGMHGGGMMPRAIERNPVIGRHENSPNPFNPSTIISVELLTEANLSVTIFDLKGRQIKNLVSQRYSPGNYQFMWDGKSQFGEPVPSGIYIYMIQSGNQITSSQITLLK
jgi:hypothetical protein